MQLGVEAHRAVAEVTHHLAFHAVVLVEIAAATQTELSIPRSQPHVDAVEHQHDAYRPAGGHGAVNSQVRQVLPVAGLAGRQTVGTRIACLGTHQQP